MLIPIKINKFDWLKILTLNIIDLENPFFLIFLDKNYIDPNLHLYCKGIITYIF